VAGRNTAKSGSATRNGRARTRLFALSVLFTAKYLTIPTGRVRWECGGESRAQTTMFKRIAAIAFIFGCAAVAWAILGSTIFYRTYNAIGIVRASGFDVGERPQRRRAGIAREWHEQKLWRWKKRERKPRGQRAISLGPVKIDASRVARAMHIDTGKKGCCGSARTESISTGLTRSESYCAGGRVCDQLPFPAQQRLRQRCNCFWTTAAGGDVQRVAGRGADSEAAGAKSVLHAAYRSQGWTAGGTTFFTRERRAGRRARQRGRKRERNFRRRATSTCS